MRYFITGGAGFIGSHLAEKLLHLGHQVTILDDLSTGSILNIEHLKLNPRFRYVIGSVADSPLTAELVDSADKIYHLAAAVGVKLIVESPVRTIETNIRCTEVVLEHATKKKKPIFIASTSEVYGKSTALPFAEDQDLVMGPTSKSRWSYACSKAIDEFLALAYFREKGLPSVVGRLFNTVGPRQSGQYGMVIPSFVQSALAGKPITVYGDGKQSRCFGHVDDVVAALILLMNRDEAYGNIFNIGSDEEISIGQLAEKVRTMTKSRSEIIYLPYDQAYEHGFEDMQRRIPNTNKIRKFVAWKPSKNLDHILTDVITYFQDQSALRK